MELAIEGFFCRTITKQVITTLVLHDAIKLEVVWVPNLEAASLFGYQITSFTTIPKQEGAMGDCILELWSSAIEPVRRSEWGRLQARRIDRINHNGRANRLLGDFSQCGGIASDVVEAKVRRRAFITCGSRFIRTVLQSIANATANTTKEIEVVLVLYRQVVRHEHHWFATGEIAHRIDDEPESSNRCEHRVAPA